MHSPSPNRAVAVAYGVTSPLRLNAFRLFVLGSVLVCLGGFGDIAYHVAPSAHFLEPFVGAEGVRAHLLTLAGMLVALAGVMGRGLRLLIRSMLTARPPDSRMPLLQTWFNSP